jgi:hypothetical protein
MERIATGWRLKAVAEPLIICTHAQTPEAILAPKQIPAADLQRCEELGQSLATGLALGIFRKTRVCPHHSGRTGSIQRQEWSLRIGLYKCAIIARMLFPDARSQAGIVCDFTSSCVHD